jgi:hypothetical protein
VAVEAARKAQMKTREVCEDCELWFSCDCCLDNSIQRLTQDSQFVDYFADAHNGDIGGIGDEIDSGCAHLRAAHAENIRDSAQFESYSEAACIEIARGFAGGKQNGIRGHAR